LPLEMRLQSLRGSMIFFGIAGINPTDIIELKGVLLRFSGNIFVSSVHQLIEGGNWTIAIDFGFKPENDPATNFPG